MMDSREVSKIPGHVLLGKLRLLDFDDLFVLQHLLEGQTIAATAKLLGLTQPAITQRVRKMERVFEEPLLKKVGRHVKLTKLGNAICLKAAAALSMMLDISDQTSHLTLNVGVQGTSTEGRLWPAVAKLRQEKPQLTYNLSTADMDNLQQHLNSGALDAAVMALQMTSNSFVSEEIFDIPYLIVAKMGLVGGGDVSEASKLTLIDLDRNLPLFSRVEGSFRGTVKFASQWYLADESMVLQAVAAGLGIAVLPAHMVSPYLASGKLQPAFSDVEIDSQTMYFSYRKEMADSETIVALKQALVKV